MKKIARVYVYALQAFAARAGVIFSQHQLVTDCIPYVSTEAIFSSTLFPKDVAALDACLSLIRQGDQARTNLHSCAKQLIRGIKELGYKTDSQSFIVSLLAGREADLEVLRDLLEDRGVFGSSFFHPATPRNRSLMRLSLHSKVGPKDIQRILMALHEIKSCLPTTTLCL